MVLEELKDIKELMIITEYSFYMLVALIAFLLTLLVLAIKKFYRRKKRGLNLKEFARKKLSSINLQNSKECAYTLSSLLPILEIDENEYEDLLESLKKYKYKKEVIPLSQTEKEKIEELRVKYGV